MIITKHLSKELFSYLLNKTIIKIGGLEIGSQELFFWTSIYKGLKVHCPDVMGFKNPADSRISGIIGDPNTILNYPVLDIRVSSFYKDPTRSSDHVLENNITLTTDRGSLIIKWYGQGPDQRVAPFRIRLFQKTTKSLFSLSPEEEREWLDRMWNNYLNWVKAQNQTNT